MNQPPGYGPHQNYPAHFDVLKKMLLPGTLIASAAALVAVIGATLPFTSVTDGSANESNSIFTLAFSGGRIVAGVLFEGVLFVVGAIFLFAPLLGAYFKPDPGQMKLAGLKSIAGGVIGIVTVLLMIFVFEREGGGTPSELMSELQAWGLDAGFGVGFYLTIAAFIVGAVGGIIFFIQAGAVERALQAEQATAMQRAPMGHPYQ